MVTEFWFRPVPIRWVLLLMIWTCAATSVCAQPLRDRVLDDVVIEGRCIVVGFSFPIQYVSHFPLEASTELRVKIRPTLVGRIDGEAVFKREAVRPPGRRRVHLSIVVYEGDVSGGPYLTLNFTREVGFKVEVGRDHRSIVITVENGGKGAPCTPKG